MDGALGLQFSLRKRDRRIVPIWAVLNQDAALVSDGDIPPAVFLLNDMRKRSDAPEAADLVTILEMLNRLPDFVPHYSIPNDC